MSASKAIIFDLDDTLYAERDYVRSGFQAIADWIAGGPGPLCDRISNELDSLYEVDHSGDTFQKWLVDRIDGEFENRPTVAEMINIYRNHSPTISAHPASAPLLIKLKASQFKLGLVSDGYLNVQRKKFAALALESHFQAVVFSDELGRTNWKPSVKPFETVLQRLGIDAPDAIYVADNPRKDFIGPRKLGMRSIRVRAPGGVYAEQEAEDALGEPDLEVPGMDDVAAAIDLLLSQ